MAGKSKLSMNPDSPDVWVGSQQYGPYMMYRDHNGFFHVTGPGIPSSRWFTNESRALEFIHDRRVEDIIQKHAVDTQQAAHVLHRLAEHKKEQGVMAATATVTPKPKPDSLGYEVVRAGLGWTASAWWGEPRHLHSNTAWRPFKRWAHYKGSAMLLRGLEEPDRFEIKIERTP